MEENDIRDVLSLCKEPLQRGCDETEIEYLDSLVLQIRGHTHVPYTVEEARSLYLDLIAEF